MPAEIASLLVIAGRVLLGGLFVVGGVHHLFILPMLTQLIVARGLPFARLALLVGTAFQVAVGLLLMLGLFVPFAAFGLIGFTLAASFLMLNFWDLEGPAREAAITTWQSNMAIIGGLLIAAAQAGT